MELNDLIFAQLRPMTYTDLDPEQPQKYYLKISPWYSTYLVVEGCFPTYWLAGDRYKNSYFGGIWPVRSPITQAGVFMVRHPATKFDCDMAYIVGIVCDPLFHTI